MKRVLVLGGYGVFGSLIARELAQIGLTVTIAGRDGGKAEAFARSLGDPARGLALDAGDPSQCRAAFVEQEIVVHAAGPFSSGNAAVLEACVTAKKHYVDIADDRAYAAVARSFDARFREAGCAAVYGASSLPGISGALALRLQRENQEPPRRIRVTLFIGNHNPKGEAAVRSAFSVLGKEILSPQGTLKGFGDPETVELPPPWGNRTVFNFESPEYDLFAARFGAGAVSVKLGFESRAVTRGFSLLARTPRFFRQALLKPLLAAGNALSGFGSSGGAVVVEFFQRDGLVRRALHSVPEGGQRMAILPCVQAVLKLASNPCPSGTSAAYDFLEPEVILFGDKSYWDPAKAGIGGIA